MEIPKDPRTGLCLLLRHGGGQGHAQWPPPSPRRSWTTWTLTDSLFASVEIAGPGFLNFRLGAKWYGDVLAEIEAEGPLRTE